jgi:hypothetical protein
MTDHSPEARGRSAVHCTRDAVAVLAATACAALTWLLVAELPGVYQAVHTNAGIRPVGIAEVIVAALVSASIGFAGLRAVERHASDAIQTWSFVASLAALASMLSPVEAITRKAALALVSLHSVVAAVVVATALHTRA